MKFMKLFHARYVNVCPAMLIYTGTRQTISENRDMVATKKVTKILAVVF